MAKFTLSENMKTKRLGDILQSKIQSLLKVKGSLDGRGCKCHTLRDQLNKNSRLAKDRFDDVVDIMLSNWEIIRDDIQSPVGVVAKVVPVSIRRLAIGMLLKSAVQEYDSQFTSN